VGGLFKVVRHNRFQRYTMSARWVLAIEASGIGGSVALLESPLVGGLVLVEQLVLPADRGSVSTLAPAVDAILRARRLRVSDLAVIAVTAGPGSFTGLRVGLATAKLLGWAASKPIAAVDSLAAVAKRFQLALPASSASQSRPAGWRAPLVTIVNAFRKQVFTASWYVDAEGIQPVRPSVVVDLSDWLHDPWGAEKKLTSEPVGARPLVAQQVVAEQQEVDQPVWVSGSGASLVSAALVEGADQVQSAVPSRGVAWRLATEELWQPMAEQVGHLGWQTLLAGRAVDAAALQPNYLRASAAEEKRRVASGS